MVYMMLDCLFSNGDLMLYWTVKTRLSDDRCQNEFVMWDTSNLVVGGDPFGDP